MKISRRSNESLGRVYQHYRRCWGPESAVTRWERGPAHELGEHFRVLVFPPGSARTMWTYATVGMFLTPEAGQQHGLELHLLAPDETEDHVELLTAVAHYHLTGHPLGWGHTVNFGRPWYPGSQCSYGLISLPYLDGSELEWMNTGERATRFLWLIPITRSERKYKGEQGLEALEQLFENGFNYLDPFRSSVV